MITGSPRRRDLLSSIGYGKFCLLRALTLPLLLFATVALSAPAAIEVERAWCATPPKGVRIGACYLALRNDGKIEDRLLGVEAEAAGRVELHVTKVADGVGRMRPLADGVDLPPESVVDFREKGYHLMLVDLRGPLAEGETMRGTLRFERAGPRPVLFHIERPGAH
ncbi:copper chaperone PCu(A)C [Methylosinus sporium]|nr:copper chaperone PCu(A)C [Methylosinus sporium]PWB94887.1 hypothetical protein C5689_05410 [Methylosinus sporium]